jgi:peptidoglycan-associated lipoprotein
VAPIVPAFPVRIQQERVMALRTVHFAFDSWALDEEAQAILAENGNWLKANPDVAVRVEGHADERGTSEYNLALGERRAKIVRDFLIRAGVPDDNLITVSYGEEMPVDPASSPEAWSLNRRAEFSRAEGKQVSSVSGPRGSG